MFTVVSNLKGTKEDYKKNVEGIKIRTNYQNIIDCMTGIYENHLENGADLIVLNYDDDTESLIINVRCNDDAYPYFVNSDVINCSLKDWSKILYMIASGRLIDERTHEAYPIKVSWSW